MHNIFEPFSQLVELIPKVGVSVISLQEGYVPHVNEKQFTNYTYSSFFALD